MGVPRVAVSVGQDAEALSPADPVLGRDPEAAEAAVVVLLVGGQFATLGLRVGDVEVGVVLVVALVGAVGVAARVRRQGRFRAADRQIMPAAGMRVRHADDAAVAGDDVLGLHGVALLLARRSEEHTSELQSRQYLVCRLLLEKKNTMTHSSS